jgi:hypothetical protein
MGSNLDARFSAHLRRFEPIFEGLGPIFEGEHSVRGLVRAAEPVKSAALRPPILSRSSSADSSEWVGRAGAGLTRAHANAWARVTAVLARQSPRGLEKSLAFATIANARQGACASLKSRILPVA